MPKTNLCKREIPHAQLGRLLAGAAVIQKKSSEDVARMIGRCENTARSRMRHPGDLTVNELVRLAKGLEIPIAELRDAIRY